jgi:3-oxoacyl-[acyl-carrier protein] reductase
LTISAVADALTERLGLAGKVALVAGGGGGLGRACALEFARAGVRLAICDRDPILVEEARALIADIGVEVFSAVVDVTEPAALQDFYRSSRTTFGRLDIVVNAVGLPLPESFVDSTMEHWEECVTANFLWLMRSMRFACDEMRTSGGGSIINFTTIEAHRSAPNNAVYAGAKAAVTHASRTLAVELAPYGIRVNMIAPDITPTERVRTLPTFLAEPDSDDGRIGAQYFVPLGRLGTYGDIGGCALFLASDLSGYITGQTLHADGGTFASSGWTYWPGPSEYGHGGFLPVPPPHVMDHFRTAGWAPDARPRES